MQIHKEISAILNHDEIMIVIDMYRELDAIVGSEGIGIMPSGAHAFIDELIKSIGEV